MSAAPARALPRRLRRELSRPAAARARSGSRAAMPRTGSGALGLGGVGGGIALVFWQGVRRR